MDLSQTLFILFLIPFLLAYSLLELRRGWNILKHNKLSLNFVFLGRVSIVKLVYGKKDAEKLKAELLGDQSKMRLSGFWSLIGGLLGIVVCLYWIYLLI